MTSHNMTLHVYQNTGPTKQRTAIDTTQPTLDLTCDTGLETHLNAYIKLKNNCFNLIAAVSLDAIMPGQWNVLIVGKDILI